MALDARIRRLTETEVASAGALLGRAFTSEPIFRAFMDTPDHALEFCTEVFVANLRHAIEFGEPWIIETATGQPGGVAYTTLKPEPMLTAHQQDTFGFTRLMARWGHLLTRIGTIEEEAVRALGDPGPTWRYLAAIGIDPPVQGQGLGTALVRHIVERAQNAGEPLALITDRRENVPFYERAGFRTVATGESPVPGLFHWSMLLSNE